MRVRTVMDVSEKSVPLTADASVFSRPSLHVSVVLRHWAGVLGNKSGLIGLNKNVLLMVGLVRGPELCLQTQRGSRRAWCSVTLSGLRPMLTLEVNSLTVCLIS